MLVIAHPAHLVSFCLKVSLTVKGGPEEFDFSFDGKEIAFTTQLGDDIAWSTDLNVYLVTLTTLEVTVC